MQMDLHYYGLAFLARASGYCAEEAQTIAYASQYVDDSTEGDPIAVGDYLFDPIRTAHYFIHAFTWGAQQKIFIPFHFLPPFPHKCDLVTRPASVSTMSNILIRDACREKESKRLRLIRIGAALHTIADTFSHQGFSGRRHSENIISDCHGDNLRDTVDNQNGFPIWDYLWDAVCSASQMVKSTFCEVLPVGHVGAFNNPDLPYLIWQYKRDLTGELIVRSNPEIFNAACAHLYGLLRDSIQRKYEQRISKDNVSPYKAWDEIRAVIASCISFKGNEEQRCENWKNAYAKFFGEELPAYDKYAWRMDALAAKSPDQVMWDKISREEFASYRFNHNPRFFSSDWVGFHRAALKQRFLVLFYML